MLMGAAGVDDGEEADVTAYVIQHKQGCVSAPFCHCAGERIAELEAKLAEAERERDALRLFLADRELERAAAESREKALSARALRFVHEAELRFTKDGLWPTIEMADAARELRAALSAGRKGP